MKIILNKDVPPLGEEGDVKEVAKGYARNYLFPRNLALPYTDKTVKLFESRQGEIEARKAQKRQDAAGLKERIEAVNVVITMPAGPNGKLYGAVTNQTVLDEFVKLGFDLERKRIEVPGNHIKSVGKYKVTVRLYENASAEINLTVQAQMIKEEPKAAAPDRKRGRRYNQADAASEASPEAAAQEEAANPENAAKPEDASGEV